MCSLSNMIAFRVLSMIGRVIFDETQLRSKKWRFHVQIIEKVGLKYSEVIRDRTNCFLQMNIWVLTFCRADVHIAPMSRLCDTAYASLVDKSVFWRLFTVLICILFLIFFKYLKQYNMTQYPLKSVNIFRIHSIWTVLY